MASIVGLMPEQATLRVIPKIWKDDTLGLSKVNSNGSYESIAKPTLLSTVTIEVEHVTNAEGVPSKILGAHPGKQVHRMGTAETPLDFNVEVLLLKMLLGESSHASVARKTGKDHVTFSIRLLKIENLRYFHQLSTKELIELATEYKERGVRLFKEFPVLAHVYFGRAHKLLHSYPGYIHLRELTVEEDGIDGKELGVLASTVRSNLAACLLAEKRYEDLIDLLDRPEDAQSEKAMYRKAQALSYVKRYEEALGCIEGVDWQKNPAMFSLHGNIKDRLAKEKENYAAMVKKMFK